MDLFQSFEAVIRSRSYGYAPSFQLQNPRKISHKSLPTYFFIIPYSVKIRIFGLDEKKHFSDCGRSGGRVVRSGSQDAFRLGAGPFRNCSQWRFETGREAFPDGERSRNIC